MHSLAASRARHAPPGPRTVWGQPRRRSLQCDLTRADQAISVLRRALHALRLMQHRRVDQRVEASLEAAGVGLAAVVWGQRAQLGIPAGGELLFDECCTD